MFNDKERQRKTYKNAIALVKILMAYHGFNINQVKQHYNWTKKDCPTWLRSGHFGFTWNWFIEQCKDKPTINVNIPSTEKPFKNGDYKEVEMIVTANILNIRKGRPNQANYSRIVGTLKKGQVVKVSYCLDNWFSIYIDGVCNPGFICGNYLKLK